MTALERRLWRLRDRLTIPADTGDQLRVAVFSSRAGPERVHLQVECWHRTASADGAIEFALVGTAIGVTIDLEPYLAPYLARLDAERQTRDHTAHEPPRPTTLAGDHECPM